jgi:hypothetical protein
MNTQPSTMSEPTDPALTTDGDDTWVESPIDDETYDLLMALASKLEAIDTYRVYAGDGNADLWRELAGDEARHAERLYTELRRRIAA